MDYEKKYNAALDAARHIYDAMKSGGNFGGMEDLEVIFPELRDSEDERIICAIKEAIVDYWSDDIQAKNDILSWLEKQKEQKSIESVAAEVTKDKESAIKFLKSAGIMDDNGELAEMYRSEQKPAEWSDEDEGELQNAIDALEFLGKKGVYKSASGYDAALQAASWLKSLRPQPKQEWSEEDNEHIEGICNALTDNISNIGFYTTEALCSWLKSLPQRFSLSSWGEEIRDGFFGKFNHNSWKPSEEQMEALKEASASWMNARMGNAKLLKSLYEQLKKLM